MADVRVNKKFNLRIKSYYHLENCRVSDSYKALLLYNDKLHVVTEFIDN